MQAGADHRRGVHAADRARGGHLTAEPLQELLVLGELRVHEPAGCPLCEGSGYKGRIGLYEILQASEAFKHKIRANAPADELREQALADGLVLLRQDGMEKVLQGLTTMEQVRAAAG